MSRILARFTAAAALVGGAIVAQSIAAGYGTTISSLPAGAGSVWLLADGSRVYATADQLVREHGHQTIVLARFGSPVFGSFTRDVGAHGLLFGESSQNRLYLVDPTGVQQARQLATLALNYDAVYLGGDLAAVSAKTGGFAAPDNELWLVDLVTGALDLLARLPGASGPLTLGHDGTLFYATASLSFPPPPGSSDVIAFTARQVRSAIGPTHLTLADARVVAARFDSASALAIDDDDDLFLSDFVNVVVHEIDDLGARRQVLAGGYSGGVSPGSLQFVPGNSTPRGAVFEPFQPAGGMLAIQESDFAQVNRIRAIVAARSTLTASVANPIPRGPFDLVLHSGPSSGFAALFLNLSHHDGEQRLPVPGAEAPLFSGIRLDLPWILFAIALDPAGAATLHLDHAGAPVRLLAQAILFDAQPGLVGSSTVASLELAGR